jgi:hypothetical protein
LQLGAAQQPKPSLSSRLASWPVPSQQHEPICSFLTSYSSGAYACRTPVELVTNNRIAVRIAVVVGEECERHTRWQVLARSRNAMTENASIADHGAQKGIAAPPNVTSACHMTAKVPRLQYLLGRAKAIRASEVD